MERNGRNGGIKVPTWAVGPVAMLAGALISTAVSWGSVRTQTTQIRTDVSELKARQEKHEQSTAVHVNRELVEWRLQRLEQGMAEVLRRMGADPDAVMVAAPLSTRRRR